MHIFSDYCSVSQTTGGMNSSKGMDIRTWRTGWKLQERFAGLLKRSDWRRVSLQMGLTLQSSFIYFFLPPLPQLHFLHITTPPIVLELSLF